MREAWLRRSGVVGCGLAITALLIAVRPVASAAQVVVPNAQTNVEGNASNTLPFFCPSSSSARYQQVYLGSEVGSGTITQIAFRRDGLAGDAFGPTTINGITITLSSTSAAPDGLSATFANNIGADVTTVFSGNLTLSSAASGAVPRPFDIVIPLQSSFSFNAAGGLNLLLDVIIPTCPAIVEFVLFDAQSTPGDSVSRVEAPGSGLATGTTDTLGLITQFTIAERIPTLSEWAMIGMVLTLAGIAVRRLRRRPAISA